MITMLAWPRLNDRFCFARKPGPNLIVLWCGEIRLDTIQHFHFSDAKVNLYLLSVFITSNTDFVYHPPVVFVTSRKVFGRKCIRYKPVLYTLVLFFGCKSRKFY